ncbi:MAG: hypothetical protein FWH14_06415 [Oscillospiraceae bacterium]|nr:hypothetical protein [Oscillospiraceae bacterium]
MQAPFPSFVKRVPSQGRVFFPKTPSQSALPPTALPKGEPRVSYTNSVSVSLPLPLGEVSRPLA